MTDGRRDRYRGCLTGLALGDALGFPLEGFSPSDCLAYVEEVLGAGRAGTVARPGSSFGQYAAGTRQARELLASHAERGALDAADIARRVGRSGGEAAAVCRGAALGLLFAEEPAALVDATLAQAEPRSEAGAVAIAQATASALQPGVLDSKAFSASVAQACEPHEPILAAAVRRLPEWVRLHPPEAFERISEAAGVGRSWQGLPPSASPVVMWGLYSFLRAPDEWWQVVQCAISVGGDVATAAAIAGALSGARVGFAGLPRELAERLHDGDSWSFDALLALADRACEHQSIETTSGSAD